MSQLERLHNIVGHLESLAHAGLPTQLETFYRAGDFTKLTKTSTTRRRRQNGPGWETGTLPWQGASCAPTCDPSTTTRPCRLGDFMEGFPVTKAREQPLAAWFDEHEDDSADC